MNGKQIQHEWTPCRDREVALTSREDRGLPYDDGTWRGWVSTLFQRQDRGPDSSLMIS